MRIKNTFAVFILPLLFILPGCGSGEDDFGLPDDDVSYEEIAELLEEFPDDRKGVRGSCNTIDDQSACVDYIGSFWTDEQMDLNCGSVGVRSKNTCPYSEIGGCQVGGGTITEIIVWSYTSGGQPMPLEAVQYASGACNATISAKWVLPDDLLGE
ncbi:MAG: hypothetical protein ABIE14_02005 [Patescibacteria group bacterium]